jgi:hypothetical protein
MSLIAFILFQNVTITDKIPAASQYIIFRQSPVGIYPMAAQISKIIRIVGNSLPVCHSQIIGLISIHL